MYIGTVIANQLRIRSLPSTDGLIAAVVLVLNDVVEADSKAAQWWHLTKITRNGVVITLPWDDCWASGDYITQTSSTTPEPEPVPSNPEDVHVEVAISGENVLVSVNGMNYSKS